MNYSDKVNIRKARYLLNLSFNEFSSKFWNNKDGNPDDCKIHYESIYVYCMNVINSNSNKEYCLIQQTYNYAKDCKNGRMYVAKGQGVQHFQNKIRKFLTEDYLLDIDIINAHPSILLKIVKDYKLNVPIFYLENYVSNRKEILEKHKFNKKELLITLNSDKCDSKNKWIKAFHYEKQNLFDFIINESDIINSYYIKSDNKKNPVSSIINKLLCIKENAIINSVMKHKNIVPMFDGFMFEKEHEKFYNKLLENKDPYIRWSYKENKSDINIDDWDEKDSKDYYSVKEKFEEKNCMIIEPYKFIKRVRNRDGIYIDAFYSQTEFISLNRCIQAIGDTKKEPFITRWLNDERKKHFEGIDFRPYYKKEFDKTPEYIYNLFDGFVSKEIKDYKEPKWFIEFLKNNIADNDVKVLEYLINYTAHIIQKPDENPEIAIVIRGETGTGKDTFIEILECLLGKLKDLVHRTADMSEVFPKTDGGGFNSALKNKLILQLNEADGYDALKVKETIKDQITRKYNNIKEKYMKDSKQVNYVRIFFLSNQNSPVAIEYNDRRIFLVKTSDFNKGNADYWNNLYKNYIYNQDELNNLFSWLGNIDISKFNPENRPKTKAYDDAIKCSVPPVAQYLHKCFSEDYNPFEEYPKKPNIYKIKQSILVKKYMRFVVNNHIIKEKDFKSLPFKKELMNFLSIEVNKMTCINNVRERFTIVNKIKLLEELEKYKIDNDEYI